MKVFFLLINNVLLQATKDDHFGFTKRSLPPLPLPLYDERQGSDDVCLAVIDWEIVLAKILAYKFPD